MRRDDGEHPNGLMDFAVVETIRHLRQQGRRGLGLNFATMRAVLAGEAGEGMSQRIQAWLLRRMSDSMQIESLWKFNAKYDPDWQPRYALYDSPEHALPAAIAVARAESFWELPVIGRFLVPSERDGWWCRPPAAPAPRRGRPPAPSAGAGAVPASRRRTAGAGPGPAAPSGPEVGTHLGDDLLVIHAARSNGPGASRAPARGWLAAGPVRSRSTDCATGSRRSRHRCDVGPGHVHLEDPAIEHDAGSARSDRECLGPLERPHTRCSSWAS